MRSSILLVTTLSLGLASIARSQATPFGLREGTPKSDLELLIGPLSQQDGTPPTYFAAHVPKPHPELTVYAVVVGDSTGLCQVVGGKVIDSTGVTDIEADRVYNELKGQLTGKYGKPSAVEKSQVRWLKISDAAIPKNLDAITLSTASQPSGGILVSLRYRFANANRCQAPAAPAREAPADAL